MIEKRIKSVIPFYSIGIVWVVYGFVMSMHSMMDLVIATVVSAIVFVALRFIVPDRVIMVEAPPVDTGDETANRYISACKEELKAIRSLDLSSTKISVHVRKLEYSLDKIVNFVVKYPHKARNLRTFVDYFLPTTTKLLQNYEHLHSKGVASENIKEGMEKIEATLPTLVMSFENQLDALFEDKVLDISAEISVLKDILTREGLSS